MVILTLTMAKNIKEYILMRKINKESYFDKITGAHFNFEDICVKLNKVAHVREQMNSTPTIIKIRKQKINKAKQQFVSQKSCIKNKRSKNEYIDLKTKVLSRRIQNPDNKYAGTIKELLECNNQMTTNKNIINLGLKYHSSLQSNKPKSECDILKAKIIENRRHIKHIINKGKDSILHDLSNTCDTRNLGLFNTEESRQRSVGKLFKIKTISDSQSINSIRNIREVHESTESHKEASLKDFRGIPNLTTSFVNKPPLNKSIIAKNSESKILLLKKNTMMSKLEKLNRQGTNSIAILDPISSK